MFRLLHRELTPEKIETIEAAVAAASASGESTKTVAAIGPLRRRQRHQEACALSLLKLSEQGLLPIRTGLACIEEVFDAYPDNLQVLGRLGEAMEGVRDIDQLNLAAPAEPVFQAVFDRLAKLSKSGLSKDDEKTVLTGLATTARMMARQQDAAARAAYQRLVELEPNSSTSHYNYGLFLKTRGFFAEGMAENALARSLVAEPVESYEWNYGICATGADAGELALQVWKEMGQKIEMGRFDLPDGGYPQCKVRLAERPLAQRGKDADDPGLEETIWIQRISPCHGIIRSVLYQELGVDFGDVVLIDGAPITYHTYGEDEIPVFPHLATLRKNNYQFYDFAGTQDQPGRLEDASDDLDMDAVVYSHTEKYQVICSSCWRDPNIDHEHDRVEKNVVTGRIAAPPEISPAALLIQLDAALAKREPCRIYSPSLCVAAGDAHRAAVEAGRFEMIRPSS